MRAKTTKRQYSKEEGDHVRRRSRAAGQFVLLATTFVLGVTFGKQSILFQLAHETTNQHCDGGDHASTTNVAIPPTTKRILHDSRDVTQQPVIPAACTPDNQHRDKPNDISQKKYELVRTGEEITQFIVSELHKVGAPVVLLFGTALHEYRNGTGNCVQVKMNEDDFDLGVFREHFHYVVLLMEEIERKFSWRGVYGYAPEWENAFMHFMPIGQRVKRGFQVDIYGFEVNQPRNGLINFPWDKKRVATNAMLPLVRHKPVVTHPNSTATNDASSSIPYYYMPFDTPCYLANLYGHDFMTPIKGLKPQGGHGDEGNQYDKPRCNRTLSGPELRELEHQMSFLNQSYPLQSKADGIWDAMSNKKKRKQNKR